MDTIYDIKINRLDEKTFDLSSFKGKKILIVNVASACGYTPQYEQLQELYDNYQEQLAIIAVPCNDFGAQESGSATEIKEFCSVNFGVKFPLTEKISITKDKHPLYEFLEKESNTTVEWNFHKFLIDENGKVIESMKSRVNPLDEQILKHLG